MSEPAAADALIGHAIDTWRGRECVVTLLHAWHVSAVHELGLNSKDFAVEWVARSEAAQQMAAAWQSKSPNGLIESRLLHGRPSSVLQEVSRDSEHLIVGRSPPPRASRGLGDGVAPASCRLPGGGRPGGRGGAGLVSGWRQKTRA